MKWGLKGVWHCYSLLWFPHTPPPGRHLGVGHFDPNLNTLRPKTVLKTTSCSTSLFHRFWTQFSMIFDPKIHQKSIADRYLSQAWFRSRFLLPKPWIQVWTRRAKTFKTHWLLFKNTLCTFQNLWSSRIFTWFEFGTKINQKFIKFRAQKHIWNRLHPLMPFVSQKSSKMRSKTVPKCLVGTAAIGLGTTLTTSSWVLGLQGAFTGPQAVHFDLIWSPFGPYFQSLQTVLTSFPGQISPGKFNSQFV